jgi:protein-S-isoprenylcysteine O-methyltransferase Ste14
MFFYHPTTEVFVSSVGMVFVLMLLSAWVGFRFDPKKPIGYALLALVTLISGFMAVQGFDAIYVLYFAPAGGRWDALVEIVIVAAFLFLFALINLLFWPKRKINTQPDNGEDS